MYKPWPGLTRWVYLLLCVSRKDHGWNRRRSKDGCQGPKPQDWSELSTIRMWCQKMFCSVLCTTERWLWVWFTHPFVFGVEHKFPAVGRCIIEPCETQQWIHQDYQEFSFMKIYTRNPQTGRTSHTNSVNYCVKLNHCTTRWHCYTLCSTVSDVSYKGSALQRFLAIKQKRLLVKCLNGKYYQAVI